MAGYWYGVVESRLEFPLKQESFPLSDIEDVKDDVMSLVQWEDARNWQYVVRAMFNDLEVMEVHVLVKYYSVLNGPLRLFERGQVTWCCNYRVELLVKYSGSWTFREGRWDDGGIGRAMANQMGLEQVDELFGSPCRNVVFSLQPGSLTLDERGYNGRFERFKLLYHLESEVVLVGTFRRDEIGSSAVYFPCLEREMGGCYHPSMDVM